MIEIDDPSKGYEMFPGPVLLLAGPGTGKTYQLTHRIKFLVEHLGANSDEIAIITFTNDAARNMREQLQKPELGIPPERLPATISTIHSLGNAIVGSAPQYFGLLTEYHVVANDHIRRVLLQDAAYLVTGDRLRWENSDQCRRCGVCCKDPNQEGCKICAAYVEVLRKCSSIDFDDQIFLACEVLENLPHIAKDWQRSTRYLLVDEYQDINEAQFRLIKILSRQQTEGLFVVGDDDQSIYSFRGGSPAWIQNFAEHFEGEARIGRLAKSWRCPEHILRGAKGVIGKYYPGSVEKPDPTFENAPAENHRIQFFDVPSESWEASIIASEAAPLVKDHRVIVIVPNSKYFPPIRDALRKKGIPYRYRMSPDDEGIVRFITLSDCIENPENSLAFRHLLDLIIHSHDDLVRSLDKSNDGIKDKRVRASDLVARLWAKCNAERSLFRILTEECKESANASFLRKLKEECLDPLFALIQENGGKRSHLPRFLEYCGLLVAPGQSPVGVIEEIKEWRNEIFQNTAGASVSPVEIYNLPSSKGLEGDVVFVVGVTETLMPNPKRDLEEQSRLFYVAMTRSKKRLLLFSTRKRSAAITFKAESFQLRPSQFIDAIPKEHIEFKPIYPKKNKAAAIAKK